MAHEHEQLHGFIECPTEKSPWFKKENKERFDYVREITSLSRPPGSHGCKLTEIIPGEKEQILKYMSVLGLDI